MSTLTSAAGLVGFLSEHDPALRSFALNQLNEEVDLLWPEISNSIAQMYVTTTCDGRYHCNPDDALIRRICEFHRWALLTSSLVRLCAKMRALRKDNSLHWWLQRSTISSENTMKA